MNDPIRVRVKRLRDVPLPSAAHLGDAGVDLRAAGDAVVIPPLGRALVPTGLSFEIPLGYEIQIRPRSGLAARIGLTVLNAPGTIDAGYRGEVSIVLFNASDQPVTIAPGDRIAQAVLGKVERIAWEEAEELEESTRGAGGFGSTGRA
jgi:dUTP pyrophosphatase